MADRYAESRFPIQSNEFKNHNYDLSASHRHQRLIGRWHGATHAATVSREPVPFSFPSTATVCAAVHPRLSPSCRLPCDGLPGTQPLGQFRPPTPARDIAHRDGDRLFLPDQYNQPLPRMAKKLNL
jgi:hypothetical protein